MQSLFSTRDPVFHMNFKRPVSQLFSMTNMKHYETHVNDCSAIFFDAMRKLEGHPVDLSDWLQWYAFDVIGSITFHRRFGFMEQQRDVDGMIKDLDGSFHYTKLIAAFPGLHRWIFGNRTFTAALKRFVPSVPDPLERFLIVSHPSSTIRN